MNPRPFFCRAWQEQAYHGWFRFCAYPSGRHITSQYWRDAFQQRARDIFGCDPTADGPIYFVSLPYALPAPAQDGPA